ncbi:hypothetical protein L0Y65_00110 [Candidatus Micrarchaeota archaeon]|nr:hypothetical protein [Candidatus Micrarchaeota archaeon]
MAEGKGIAGIISCWGYGYSVRMRINGKDAGLAGGGSEGARVFSPEHEMYGEAPPAIREKLFILKEGKNEISVEFRKASENESEYLQIAIELEGYPAPVFLLHSRSKASGTLKSGVEMHAAAPEGFRPIFITDAGQDGGAFVHVEASNCSVTPSLNGREGMTLMMRGQVVLDNLNPGKNELALRYSGTSGEELKLALVCPKWMKVITRKIADETEKTETFSFSTQGVGRASAAKPAGEASGKASAAMTGDSPAGQASGAGAGGHGKALGMLKSPDALTRFSGASMLREAVEKGEDIGFAESALVAALSDKDEDARNAAARVLAAYYGGKKQWAGIERLLQHARGDVRASALYKLGDFISQFDIQSDTPGVMKALTDNDFDLRKEAAVFFEKASAQGMDIGFALEGLRKAAIYGDERVKEAAENARKTQEMRNAPGNRCPRCMDCETGFGPGNAAKCFGDMALIIKSISCCGGDVTHKVVRCSACKKHYLSTYFDHSDTGHGQQSIRLVGKEDAERIAAEFKKCPNPEFRMCKCDVHMKYLKDEKVPVKGELKYSFEDKE